MPVEIEESAEGTRFRLSGMVEISEAHALKAHLGEAIERGLGLRVELSAGSELDITAIQLLEAARREARRRSLQFSLDEPLPESVTEILRLAGLDTLPVFAGQKDPAAESGE